MSSKTRITQSQIVSTKRGWVTYTTKDGKNAKARTTQLVVVEDGATSITQRRVGATCHDCSSYARVKTAAGNVSLDSGDELAVALRGKDLEVVYEKAAKVLGESVKALTARYSHLNAGMQRMTLGNRIRAAQV